MNRSPDSNPSSGESTRAAVEAILDDERERQAREQQESRKTPQRTASLTLVALAIGAVAAWVWISPPALVQPAPFPEPTTAQIEAGLRMDMYAAALGVQRFVEDNGSLPRSLPEALEEPSDAEDLGYQPLPDGSFRLTGLRNDQRVSWSSTEPLAVLVDRARAELDVGGGA